MVKGPAASRPPNAGRPSFAAAAKKPPSTRGTLNGGLVANSNSTEQSVGFAQGPTPARGSDVVGEITKDNVPKYKFEDDDPDLLSQSNRHAGTGRGASSRQGARRGNVMIKLPAPGIGKSGHQGSFKAQRKTSRRKSSSSNVVAVKQMMRRIGIAALL